MKIFNKVFAASLLALGIYIPMAMASSTVDKITGVFMETSPYVVGYIPGGTPPPPGTPFDEVTYVFHSDGTMTRSEADAYQGWGILGAGNGGTFFFMPCDGVWEVVKNKGDDQATKGSKKVKVRAVIMQYGPGCDYPPPPATGMPNYFTAGSENLTVRRCYEFEFSKLKNGKFQKCQLIQSAVIIIDPNLNPLSTNISQGTATAFNPAFYLSRVNLEKEWFVGFSK